MHVPAVKVMDGVCDDGPVRFTAVCSVAEGSRVACEQLQRAKPCQRSMGVCDGKLVCSTAVRSVSEGSRVEH